MMTAMADILGRCGRQPRAGGAERSSENEAHSPPQGPRPTGRPSTRVSHARRGRQPGAGTPLHGIPPAKEVSHQGSDGQVPAHGVLQRHEGGGPRRRRVLGCSGQLMIVAQLSGFAKGCA